MRLFESITRPITTRCRPLAKGECLQGSRHARKRVPEIEQMWRVSAAIKWAQRLSRNAGDHLT